MMLKKMTLALSIVLAFTACSSGQNLNVKARKAQMKAEMLANNNIVNQSNNQNGSGSNHANSGSSTPAKSNTDYSNSKTPLTVHVKDAAPVARDDLISEVGGQYSPEVKAATYTLHVGKKSYTENDTVNLSEHFAKNQVSDVNVAQNLRGSAEGQSYYITQNQKWRAYRQDYSVVAGYQNTGGSSNIPDIDMNKKDDMDITSVKGQATTASQLPNVGIYNYSGGAFTQNETGGKLSYDVNFATRMGKGEITGINESGKITLHEGLIKSDTHTNEDLDDSTISGMGISSTATSEKRGRGKYTLGFFGPNAEEIAGVVEQNGDGLVGFGGKRGNAPKQ